MTDNRFESSRREFLRSVPAAAAAVTVADLLLPSLAMADPVMPFNSQNFLRISAGEFAGDIQALGAKAGPANMQRLFNDKHFSVDLWVEKKNAGKEFEWHEERDHIIQILDGWTEYEVGGKPKGAHSTGPGEWLAPESEGATKYVLKKGDWLILKRGTLHKRTTPVHVTFTLTAPRTA